MYEIQAYRSRHKNFPVLTQKQFQNLYRLIKRNHYTITVMSDVLSDILLDTSDAADWFKWLHEITEKYTLTSKAAQFEDKYLVKTVYSNRYAHYYEHKTTTAKEKKQGVNCPAF
jgi:Lhr-like helicase